MVKIAASLTCGFALLGAAQVHAQVYKWVDGNGVTHYSDQAPAEGKPVAIPEKLSVYSQSPYYQPVAYSRGDPILNGRIEALERQLRAERESRESVAAAQAQAALAAYERCLAERRVDCDEYSGFYPPYGWGGPVAVSYGRFRRPHPAPRASPLTGITAGNVVAQAPKAAPRRSGTSTRLTMR